MPGAPRFFRDVANVTMDTNDVETPASSTRSAAPITWSSNDMTGTEVTNVIVNLGATDGSTTGDARQ